MKPETYEKWEDALSSFSNVEELLKEGKSEEAAGKADVAVWLACIAVASLSKELEIPYLMTRVNHYITKWDNRLKRMKRKEERAPRETIEEARRILQRLSDELPAGTFRPFS